MTRESQLQGWGSFLRLWEIEAGAAAAPSGGEAHLADCEPLKVWGEGCEGNTLKGNPPCSGIVINTCIKMDTWTLNVDFDPDSTDNQGERLRPKFLSHL